MGKSALHTVKTLIEKTPHVILLKAMFAVLFAALFGGSLWAIAFRLNAASTGSALGEGTGTLVGHAVGSLSGLTEGQSAGFEAGKQEGLRAKDTTVELTGKIREMAKLEVLVASGTFSDVLSIGPEESPDYAALLSMKYNAVFTVDLETADIELKNDSLYILLDQPTVEFYPVGNLEKKAEYQKSSIIVETGSAKDGYDALNHSADQIQIKAEKELNQDDSLKAAARESTESQLSQLVEDVSLTHPKIFVKFREEA